MAPSPQRQRPKISWWTRMKWRLRSMESPLVLRGTVKRLRLHRWPYLALLRLCLPTTSLSWSYAVPEPLPPLSLVNDPPLCWKRRCEGDIKNLQAIPIWRSRDTPLRSLYRLYEAVMGGDEMLPVVGYETEYFFYQGRRAWELHRIPDPCDPDPIRYAILACIVESLLHAINWRLSIGLRRNGKHIPPTNYDGVNNPYAPYDPVSLPAWTQRVPPVDKQYIAKVMPERMIDPRGRLVLHTDAESDIFEKRNIVASEHKFWTI
ncbi:hypothetical protein D8B26_007283 [Coccidioides posadasii str. Silveira]|uniref:Uncharacterized protein n=2 Tax=Coccidioides posadasii TaxID=199306 RepID=A0A0J6FPS1_COCPO|nr:hypothetical protein CPC735_013250 [Coccidioides posadasii C735 delta SOWgp]EER30007.1 hypothetical protein CPC735_013250 [Coccidioides posadasii C735 delta SOWgp]KMM71455.1 hypothetical protein CPAG_07762 [Coccidioides posadasii RMSCC 3488]QVM12664.1 hypothetical protein D8B26_007283 [Coccidioides posadasii str. Silveira]|eukprot:XP_003072152.1 hypothetical protein CPC735_013250 [Coccidioides posadasii C735 delta SOWgp]